LPNSGNCAVVNSEIEPNTPAEGSAPELRCTARVRDSTTDPELPRAVQSLGPAEIDPVWEQSPVKHERSAVLKPRAQAEREQPSSLINELQAFRPQEKVTVFSTEIET